ncbi:MAG: ferrochelatase [Nitrospirae bacterium]|nr:ferrochelatase [Nitrospirota bacterium]
MPDSPPPSRGAPDGVLLVNLGTPEAPTPAALKAYLREFLADPRVVDLPRWLWLPILHGIILRTRPARSAALYRKVWTEAGAPLLAIGRAQAAGVAAVLRGRGSDAPVALGMRYGNPSIAHALTDLRDRGCARVVVVPLFPQYSIATTLSVEDALKAATRRLPGCPAWEMVADYHDHPGYLAALAHSVREAWERGGRGGHLLISFHGTPLRYRDAKGDPYFGQCQATALALAGRLGLAERDWTLTFQSRFGPEEWLQPYTDATLDRLAGDGVQAVDVVCPGFAADCLETLEEIAMGCARAFALEGGGRLRYIPALNTRPDHLAALADVAARALSRAG